MSKTATDTNKKKVTIHLDGERSGHVTKLVNELGSWKFFKYLYAKDFMKIMGLNFLMLLFFIPMVYLIFSQTTGVFATLAYNYPQAGSFIMCDNVWFGLDNYTKSLNVEHTNITSLWIALGFILSPIILSGGFAVIRDAFWTGEMKVFKAYFKGIGESALIMLPFMIILGGLFYCCNMLTVMLPLWMPSLTWLAIIISIIVWIIYIAIAIYIMMLYSVVAVHKQSLGQSMSDTWLLYTCNILPNVLSFILAFGPVVLMCLGGLLTSMGMIGSLLVAFFLVFGMFYIAFVWQTHMMKTFRLYHPVEKKRIK